MSCEDVSVMLTGLVCSIKSVGPFDSMYTAWVWFGFFSDKIGIFTFRGGTEESIAIGLRKDVSL